MNYYRPVISLKSWPSLIYRRSFRSTYYRLLRSSPSSFRTAERYSTRKSFPRHHRHRVSTLSVKLSSAFQDLEVTGRLECFSLRNASSRVLFNRDNSVLSTSWRRVGVFQLASTILPPYALSSPSKYTLDLELFLESFKFFRPPPSRIFLYSSKE